MTALVKVTLQVQDRTANQVKLERIMFREQDGYKKNEFQLIPPGAKLVTAYGEGQEVEMTVVDTVISVCDGVSVVDCGVNKFADKKAMDRVQKLLLEHGWFTARHSHDGLPEHNTREIHSKTGSDK